MLCLASSGGQQGPILAAAGANVTVFDNSPAQLVQDRSVAQREGLRIDTVQEQDAPLEFGHTLDDQIGGQLAAGFVLTGFYEDIDADTILGKHIPSFIVTRALKP